MPHSTRIARRPSTAARTCVRVTAIGLIVGALLGGCGRSGDATDDFDGLPAAARAATTSEAPATTLAAPTSTAAPTTTSTVAPAPPTTEAPPAPVATEPPAVEPAPAHPTESVEAALGEIDALLDEIDAALADTSADN